MNKCYKQSRQDELIVIPNTDRYKIPGRISPSVRLSVCLFLFPAGPAPERPCRSAMPLPARWIKCRFPPLFQKK